MQTALGAELEIKTLLGELYGSYSSADAPGPLSLLERLNRMYLFQLGSGDDGDRRRRPPGPRPPGRDAGLLAADEIDEVIGWWASYLHPGGRPLARTKAADLLPTLAVQAGDEMLAEVLHDVRSNHRVALLVLGLEDAPGVLYGRDAPRCLHCHQQRIMFDKHATLGDVWCGNGGYHAGACHNDARWPDCRDQDGRITCRRSTRSQRHCYRWSHADLGLLRDGAR